MSNSPLRVSVTRATAVVAVLVAAACAEAPTAPPAVDTDPLFSQKPTQPSPTFGVADPEWVEVCLFDDSPGSPNNSFKIEWAVDINNDGVMDGVFFRSQLKHNQCEDIWIHGTTTFDRVKIFLIAPGRTISSMTTTVVRAVPGDPTSDIFTPGPVTPGNKADGFANGNTGTVTLYTVRR